jgi:hypothetical protein
MRSRMKLTGNVVAGDGCLSDTRICSSADVIKMLVNGSNPFIRVKPHDRQKRNGLDCQSNRRSDRIVER